MRQAAHDEIVAELEEEIARLNAYVQIKDQSVHRLLREKNTLAFQRTNLDIENRLLRAVLDAPVIATVNVKAPLGKTSQHDVLLNVPVTIETHHDVDGYLVGQRIEITVTGVRAEDGSF